MNMLLFGLALGGLFGCYDIARRMNRYTNHGIRIAVILMGLGCIMTMAGKESIALALVLAGLGLFHAADRRGDHGRYQGRVQT
jgi:hypothetical protein